MKVVILCVWMGYNLGGNCVMSILDVAREKSDILGQNTKKT